jgi:hypothetical protein
MQSSDRQVAGVKLTPPGNCWTSVVDPNRTSLPPNFGVNLLFSIALPDRVALAGTRLSVWCSLRARLYLAAVDKRDRWIEDHPISRLIPVSTSTRVPKSRFTPTLRISALPWLTTATCIPLRLKIIASAGTERLGVLRGMCNSIVH